MDNDSSPSGGPLATGRPPFSQVPWAVTFNRRLSMTARVVYDALARYADWNGHDDAHPSLDTIADGIGVSRETVKRAIRELAAHGVIRVEKREDTAGRQMSNRYDLTPSWSNLTTRGVMGDPGEGVTSDPGEGVMGDPQTRTPMNENPMNESRAPVPAAPRPDVDRLCVLLRNHVHDVTERRPWEGDPPKAWRTAMRLLIDRDGVPPDRVEACIRWLGGPTKDGQFWSRNILSPAKLRAQWPRLVAAAKAERNGTAATRNRTKAERWLARVEAIDGEARDA